MTPIASPTRSDPPLLSLQVLRAVAALLVVLHHAGYDADTIAARTGMPPLSIGRWFDGSFGIHLFFVISGYIMLRTARGFGSARGAVAFMARRIVRVVPLYWMLTTLVLLGTAIAPALLNTPPGGPAVVIGSYLFIPVMRADGQWRPVLGQGWTLDYEMFFYALFALAMLFPRRVALAGLAFCLLALVALGRVIPTSGAALVVWTDGLLLEFLFGLLLGLLQERGVRLDLVASSLLVVLGGLGAVALGSTSRDFGGLALLARAGGPAAAIVGGCVLGPRWPASRVVLALAIVGDASYSLYLSHPFAIRLLREAWLATPLVEAPTALYLGGATLAAVATSVLLYRWVERPMTRWLQRVSPMAGHDRRPILPDVAAPGSRL